MTLFILPLTRLSLGHLIKQVRKRESYRDEIYIFSKILLVLSHCYDKNSNAQQKYKEWGEKNLTENEIANLLYIRDRYIKLNIDPIPYIEYIISLKNQSFSDFMYEYIYEEPVAYRSKVGITPSTNKTDLSNLEEKEKNAANILLSLQG